MAINKAGIQRFYTPAEWHFRLDMNYKFGKLFRNAQEIKVGILYKNRHLKNGYSIATIFKNTEVGNEKTINLIDHAIGKATAIAVDDLAMPYRYLLHIDALLPDVLKKQGLQQEMEGFLLTVDHNATYRMLRRCRALEREFTDPIKLYRSPKSGTYSLFSVDEMFQDLFGGLVRNATARKINIKYSRLTISSANDLKKKLDKGDLEFNGEILMLYQKALRAAIEISKANGAKKIKVALDLSRITMAKLAKAGLNKLDVDMLLDEHNGYKLANAFYGTGALNITKAYQRKSDGQDELFRVLRTDLLYPEVL